MTKTNEFIKTHSRICEMNDKIIRPAYMSITDKKEYIRWEDR